MPGAWAPTRYGADDQMGTWQEVTRWRTRRALELLQGGGNPKTYGLGETMFNGFPAFPTDPPRLHEQQLVILGNDLPPGSNAIKSAAFPAPAGPNEITGYETGLSTSGGTSDGRFIAPTGAQVLELGAINATIHQVNECVGTDDLDRLSLIYRRILEKLLA